MYHAYLVADAGVDLAAGKGVQYLVCANVQQTGSSLQARAAGLRKVRQRLLVSGVRALDEVHVAESQHGRHHTEHVGLSGQ